MFKIFYQTGLFLVLAFLLTACVPRDIPIDNFGSSNHSWGEMTDINDVNMSDFDENLTESETMITEEGEENKLERIPFPVSEYYRLPRLGKGTIKGKIYILDSYGNKVVGANTRLYLNPLTSYSKQWYEESYLGGYRMQKADSRLFNYLKFTASDVNGNFSFYGVPSGRYYLIGTVTCGESCGYAEEKSIRIATVVTVSGNQIVKKDLTRERE
ncbi:hypothetical protein MNB_SV-3-212 [hydrothermal vent metagenome]|uniref:Carboxypeptidase regulatory-like domain-containing protein n=1 Tax=hydrothermal vent metagenome TaxID=652676 RepID=A0A1W1BJ70_9ZZZZ